MSAKKDCVEFETAVAWAFHADAECGIPGLSKYKSDLLPGERVSLPRAVAEVRVAAGLGQILEDVK